MKKFKIVVDINHPAHVHFFKNFIWEMQKQGHKFIITAGEKDVAFKLLENYRIPYTNLGGYGKNIVQKSLNIPVLDWRMFQAVKKFNPDVFLGLGSFRASHVAALMKKPCILFEDSEPTPVEHAMYLPFATYVFTPNCFHKNFGRKQIRYEGYHELAYLHPDYFVPNPNILNELKVKNNDYFVLRFVAWQAGHDLGHHGFSLEDKIKLVKMLSKRGKVLISAEGEMPSEFAPFAFKISPDKMHDALYYAKLFVGDSQTMATEAALLGTPAVRCNSFSGRDDMGNFLELEKKYHVMYSFNDSGKALRKIQQLLDQKNLKKEWARRRLELFADKIDVTKMMIEFVSKFVKGLQND